MQPEVSPPDSAPPPTDAAAVQPRVALAIFTLLFTFVGVFVTVLGLFADDLYLLSRAEADRREIERPNGALDRYRRLPDERQGDALFRELGQRAFALVDPEPYLQSTLWRGIRVTMKGRGLALLMSFIGAILLLRRSRRARPLLILAFGILIAAGAAEAMLGGRDGPMVFDEYRRDLGNAFRIATEAAGVSDQFPTMRSPIERPQPGMIHRMATGYYLLATLPWQILLLALVARRVHAEPTPVAMNNPEIPCAAP